MSAKKPVAVFLHGLGGSSADWEEAAKKLGKGFDVRRLDLPGSAAGPFPKDGYDPAALALWVKSTLEKEKLKSFFLIGHSTGARVAGELAALSPERVDALVLVSPLGAISYGLAAKLKWKAMSRRSILESVAEATMRKASGYGFSVAGAGKEGFVKRAMAARTGPSAKSLSLAVEKLVDGVLSAPPLAERLRGTTMPLLILAGPDDPLAPIDDSRALLRTRPDAEFDLIVGTGHYPMLEAPAQVASCIKEFLARS
ncbi:MAG: alpha/beta hydrolase [Thermoanaerobaculia bacterium]